MENKKIVINFEKTEEKEIFLDLLSSVIGVHIDGENQEHCDNYGSNLIYISENKNNLKIKS